MVGRGIGLSLTVACFWMVTCSASLFSAVGRGGTCFAACIELEEEEEEGGDVFAANVDTLTGVDTTYKNPLPNPQFIPHCPR